GQGGGGRVGDRVAVGGGRAGARGGGGAAAAKPVARADRGATHRTEADRNDLGSRGHFGEPLEELAGLRLAARVHVLPDVEAVAADRRDRPAGAEQRKPPPHRGPGSTPPPRFSTPLP